MHKQEWLKLYSAYTSGYQSVDRLSDIDEFEENFRYLSVVDKTRQYYTLCRTASPIDTPTSSPRMSPKKSFNDVEDDSNNRNSLEWENEMVKLLLFLCPIL